MGIRRHLMKKRQSIAHISYVVEDYDEAISFFTDVLEFELIEDTYQVEQDKRWVVVSPPNSTGVTLLLAKASTTDQAARVGAQTGGRVFLFLSTDNFWRDYNDLVAKGVRFERAPIEEAYGTVAVFEDIYGNLWDLIQYRKGHPMHGRGM